MIDHLEIKSPSDSDVWCVVLLIYRTRGIATSSHYITELNEGQRIIFRRIFENNTSQNRELFFSNTLIRHIWN